MRSTFEARGYTAWDPTSPPWLLDDVARHHARHPDSVRELDGRRARQEDAAPAFDGIAVEAGGPHSPAVRLEGAARQHHMRPRAGILPRRPPVLFQPSRPDQRRPHTLRRASAEGAGDGGPLFRGDPRARAGLHDGSRTRALSHRRPGEDPPQRSRARPVRACADLRERQRRHRSPDDDDGDAAEDGAEVRPRLPAAREAVRGRERIRQASELEHERRSREQPAEPGRDAARKHPVPGVLRRRDARGQQVPGAAPLQHRQRRATITVSARTKRRRRSSPSSSATC